MNGKDDNELTDPKCPLKSKNLVKTLDHRLNWSDKLSWKNMTDKDKEFLRSVKDKDTGDCGIALWDPFLKHQPVDSIEIKIDYHCCNIYTLLTRLDASGKGPTCIFMIIGTLFYLLTT